MAIQHSNWVFVLLFVGVFALSILIHLVFYLVLKCDIRASNADVSIPLNLERRRTAVDLPRRAGLAGILSSERIQVFRAFFEKRALTFRKTEDNYLKEDDVEAPSNERQGEDERQEEENKKLDRTCPICLNEYDENDKIITGTSCSHMFHYECCMKWLENGNEHCPNCRTDMMTSDELFQAALDELGEARIMKAARRYETAILRHRLEALTRQHQEASRTANESNNSNVHLHQPSQ